MTNMIGFIITFYLILIIIISLYGVASYVLQALGMMQIAKNRTVHAPWLAWIPYANMFQIGLVADEFNVRFLGRKSKFRIILLIMNIVVSVLGIITSIMIGLELAISGEWIIDNPYIMLSWLPLLILLIAATVVYYVFYYLSLYRIYKWCSQKEILLLIFSIIFPVITPFVLFSIRKGFGSQYDSQSPVEIQQQ